MTTLEEEATPVQETTRRSWSILRTQRALQIVLGLLWLLDGGLQFQSFMFGRAFVTTYILPNASGQPAVIAWVITNIGHFLEPHIAVWNTFFALIQVGIGAGLLYRRTVRPALLVSFFWVLGVWVLGEGLGMILTGSASALTGAPGSVLMYGLIGLMAWPRGTQKGRDDPTLAGMVSAPAGRGLGGPMTPLAVWAGFWALAAVLFLLPDNRTQTSVASAITGMAQGEPGAYAHFLSHLGTHFGSVGVQSSWFLAIASLAVGFGPLLVRRPTPFLVAGGILSVVFWVSGQGLGGVFTGSGTDPNTAPLVILLALAMVPTVLPDPAAWRSPFSLLLARFPVVAIGSVVTLAVALFLSAAYPVAAQESTSTAMAGMVGMSDMAGTDAASAATASCNAANNGAPRTGLNLTNTPNMMMAAGLGMDMNGSDASAAAGLNSTKANWHYTGPPLSQALSQELLADGSNGPDDIHMAENGCTTEPTFSQEINAFGYVQSTSAAAARLSSPALALAAGYVAVSRTTYPVVYYLDPTVAAANAAAQRTLSSQHIDGLVFAQTPAGGEVLAAALYLLPSTVTKAPMPYGALVQWHQRTDTCGPSSIPTSNPLEITGVVPCAAGNAPRDTPYMTMVWEIPVAGGPLAIQPPDIQIVEAAIMASTP